MTATSDSWARVGQIEVAGALYALFSCQLCGALVTGHGRSRHDGWHDHEVPEDIVRELERQREWYRALLVDVLGDLKPDLHSPAIDAAREWFDDVRKVVG